MAPDQANPYDSIGEIQAYSGHYDEAIAIPAGDARDAVILD